MQLRRLALSLEPGASAAIFFFPSQQRRRRSCRFDFLLVYSAEPHRHTPRLHIDGQLSAFPPIKEPLKSARPVLFSSRLESPRTITRTVTSLPPGGLHRRAAHGSPGSGSLNAPCDTRPGMDVKPPGRPACGLWLCPVGASLRVSRCLNVRAAAASRPTSCGRR